MTVLQISSTEGEDYSRAFSDPMKEITESDAEWRFEVIKGRLRSRCCGLIEVQEPAESWKISKALSNSFRIPSNQHDMARLGVFDFRHAIQHRFGST
jgi:hypothetical protein